ncbi:MAG TPA: hypothetical protein VEC02_06205 [Nitrososphaerales archaeon]|nr:hypothetical protein [Nitrososphaerales archaeon]
MTEREIERDTRRLERLGILLAVAAAALAISALLLLVLDFAP